MPAADALAIAHLPRAPFLIEHVNHTTMHKLLAPPHRIYSDGALFAFIVAQIAQRYPSMDLDSRKEELPALGIIASSTLCGKL